MEKLTVLNTCCGLALRRDGCDGYLVLAKSDDKGCCCDCTCEKRILHSWTQIADGGGYIIPNLCAADYCECGKWQIIARRTDPGFSGYPRVIQSGTISEPNGDDECCLSGLLNPFYAHLGVKGYRVWYELWIMCEKKEDGTPESAI